MGLFPSLTQEIAIDLGTANTVITSNGRIVVDQPSIIAIDTRTEKLVANSSAQRRSHSRLQGGRANDKGNDTYDTQSKLHLSVDSAYGDRYPFG